MAKRIFSRDFIYRELKLMDCHVLQELAEKSLNDQYFPSILGKTVVENKDLASAYSTNKALYPHAFVIFEKVEPKKPIGFLVTQSSKKENKLDLEIVIPGENTEYKQLNVLTEFINFIGPGHKISWHCNAERIIEVCDALASTVVVED